jgi:hypothetical protein
LAVSSLITAEAYTVGSVLCVAGVSKMFLSERERRRAVLAVFLRRVAGGADVSRLLAIVLHVLGITEVTFGVLLILRWQLRFVALGTTGLLALGVLYLVWGSVAAKGYSCGCIGSGGTVGVASYLRLGAVLAGSVVTLVVPRGVSELPTYACVAVVGVQLLVVIAVTLVNGEDVRVVLHRLPQVGRVGYLALLFVTRQRRILRDLSVHLTSSDLPGNPYEWVCVQSWRHEDELFGEFMPRNLPQSIVKARLRIVASVNLRHLDSGRAVMFDEAGSVTNVCWKSRWEVADQSYQSSSLSN